MTFWKSASGMVEVELTSADISDAFRAMNELDIPIFHVQQISDLTCRFWIGRNRLPVIKRLAEKRGETLHILGKRGLFWSFHGMMRRPVLVIGILLFLCLASYLPSRVLFVRVDGNSEVPTNQILSAAEECGIRFWASRREVRSERVKNALLSAVPQLQWAGVNTYGCVAVISVRERTEVQTTNEETGVCSIVAAEDGIIESCTALRGNLLCSVGQAVKEGEILISGYTDCGICIQATRAEGEIFAQTRRDLSVITMSQSLYRGDTSTVKHKYSILIGKKRINLWKDSGIWDATCGRMYEEYYITLPGGYQLPVALSVETYTFYESTEAETDAEAAGAALKSFALDYLSKQMVAGRILNSTMEVYAENGVYRLEGAFLCSEMIGRVQREKIGE